MTYNLLSRALEHFATVDKFVDLDLYYKSASCSLVEIIHLGKRKKVAANTLTKETVHSYFVALAWQRYVRIVYLCLDLADLRVHRF